MRLSTITQVLIITKLALRMFTLILVIVKNYFYKFYLFELSMNENSTYNFKTWYLSVEACGGGAKSGLQVSINLDHEEILNEISIIL